MSTKSRRAKEFPGQHEGETVSFVFRQHPVVLRKQIIYGLIVMLLAIVPLDFPQSYSSPLLEGISFKVLIIVPLLVFLYWFHRWVGWYYSVYIVTNRRIVEVRQKGFFDRRVTEWQLDKIYNINYHVDGFQAAMLGYGDLIAKTVIGEFVMPMIQHPTEIHQQLLDAVSAVGGVRQTPFDR